MVWHTLIKACKGAFSY